MSNHAWLPAVLVAVSGFYICLMVADWSYATDIAGFYAIVMFVLTCANLARERWSRP